MRHCFKKKRKRGWMGKARVGDSCLSHSGYYLCGWRKVWGQMSSHVLGFRDCKKGCVCVYQTWLWFWLHSQFPRESLLLPMLSPLSPRAPDLSMLGGWTSVRSGLCVEDECKKLLLKVCSLPPHVLFEGTGRSPLSFLPLFCLCLETLSEHWVQRGPLE